MNWSDLFLPYLLTAGVVAVLGFVIVTAMQHQHRHPLPFWLRALLAWGIGLAWPLISIWAFFYFGGGFGWLAWRWVLGEHNKPARIVRVDLLPSHSMAGYSGADAHTHDV